MKTRRLWVAVVVMLMVIAGAAVPTYAAGGWAKIAGVDGESQDKDHGRWIEVLAAPTIIPGIKGTEGGSVKLSIIGGKSVTMLQSFSRSHHVFSSVIIDAPPVKKTLKNVTITSMSARMDAKTGKQTAYLSLHYEK